MLREIKKYDVALIITHFNQLEFLKNLLSFLKANDWANCSEVIVVDDFSLNHENQRELKNSFDSITFLFLNKNVGPSRARNIAVDNTTYKYLQFLDADDWIDPRKVSLQYNFAIKNNFPAFVGSKWTRVGFNSSYTSPIIKDTHDPDFTTPTIISIMKGFFPLMCGLILKETFLKVNGFDEKMRLIEDINLAIRMNAVNGSFINFISSEPLFFYRIGNAASLSNSNKEQFDLSILKNYHLAYNQLKLQGVYDKSEINALKNKTLNIIWHLYLSAIIDKNIPLLHMVLEELSKIKLKGKLNLYGKKYFLCRMIGFRNFSILALKGWMIRK